MSENKTLIANRLSSENKKVGCYSVVLDKASTYTITRLLDEVEGCSDGFATDVDIRINRKHYVAELSIVEDEVDFVAITKAEYIDRYGNERYS